MRRSRYLRGLAMAPAWLAAVACSSTVVTSNECIPGVSIVCACTDGRSGAQRCEPDRSFGPCVCVDSSDGSAGDGSPEAPSDAGSEALDGREADGAPTDGASEDAYDVEAAPEGPCGPIGTMAAGLPPLVDLFVVENGVVIVRRDEVRFMTRKAALVRSVTWPRPILSVTYSGSILVVADTDAFTTVSVPELVVGPTVFVSDACASGMIIAGYRYICSGHNAPFISKEHRYYTYDLKTGGLLQTSGPFDDHAPMRRIPGTDDFVSGTQWFTGYALFKTWDVTGKAAQLGAIGASDAALFAFHASADSVVGSTGAVYQMHKLCTASDPTSGCFAKDGNLGTLETGQRFAAMVDDGSSTLYAVASKDAPACLTCSVQKINLTARTIVTQKAHSYPDAYEFVTARQDPWCGTLVLGYHLGEYAKVTGHRVVVADY